ncbi:MAG: PIG-L family deacetylase [Confluentimicrobium sp.]|nr:PIG-L family deacetylase [Actibacterium sp.]
MSLAPVCELPDDTAGFQSAGLAELVGTAPVLILAPHPDDESLGCGGLIAAARDQGIPVHVICMTDGAASHPQSHNWGDGRLAMRREAELIRAVGHLGCAAGDVSFLRHPDGWLGAQDRDAIAYCIGDLCDRMGAGSLFASAAMDHHADHKATAAIAAEVARHRPALRHWSYPVWSRWDDPAYAQKTGGVPRRFDTQLWQNAKRAAIDAHDSQLGRVVDDDPSGFAMSPDFTEFFATAPEVFIKVPPCR